jgi:hypothetical protein
MTKKILIAVATFLGLLVLYNTFVATPPVTNAHPSGTAMICFGDSLTWG